MSCSFQLFWKRFLSPYPPISPECDWLLISPYFINLKSNVKVMRMKEMITDLRSSWLSHSVIRFVSTTLRKVRESSMEIGNTDVSVKGWTFSFPIIHLHSRSVLFNNPSYQFHQLFSPSFFFTPIFLYFSLRFSCLCCCCFNLVWVSFPFLLRAQIFFVF